MAKVAVKNGERFESGKDYPGGGMWPRPWWRINGEPVTSEEFTRRWRLACAEAERGPRNG